MDLWVIAAATGAGYIAKILRNSLADQKEYLRVQCSSYDVQSESNKSLQQFRDRAESFGHVDYSEINGGLSAKDVELSDDDAFVGVNGCELRDFSRVAIGNPTGYRRAHLLSIKPFSSVRSRSRVDVRVLKEHRNYMVYEHVCLNTNDVGARLWKKDVGLRDVGTMLEFESVEESRKPSFDNSGDSISGNNAMLLFVSGMMMGIMLAAKTRKYETDHTSQQLNHTDDSVRDLHELETNEKLVFEDLAIKNNTKEHVEKTEERVETSDNDVLMSDVNKSENEELMSKIEGELQFELELLERSINASSNAEIDSDLELEVVRGDLKLAKEIIRESSYEPEKEKMHTYNPQPPQNYAVSPWELTLRLHELIESRLQERIEELETALHDNNDQALNSQDVIIRKMESSSHHLLPHNQFMRMRNLPRSATFARNYPEVYEVYNGSVAKEKDKNQENENGALSMKALHQPKPFIRPKI